MKRILFALVLLAPVLPPSVSHADGPTTIAGFLETGGRPRVIAHRGFSAAAPENTLAAVRAAIEVGADMVIVSSFSPAALEQMRSVAPEIRTAVLYNPDLNKGRDPVGIVRGVGASAFNVKRTRLTRTMLERCHEAGIPVAVYTANRRRHLRKLVRMGVDAVFTDHPDRLLEVLEASGAPADISAAVPDAHGTPDMETETDKETRPEAAVMQ